MVGVSTSEGETGAFFWRREGVLIQRAFRRARLGICQCFVNRLQMVIHLALNLLIPESNYSITLLSEIRRSCRVPPFLCLLGMLAAVEFDNEAPLDTTKVGKVSTNPMLAAKLETTETLRSKLLP